MESYWIIGIVAYILLGLHSAYFFVRRYTLDYDFELDGTEVLQVVVSFFLPIITHIATYFIYDRTKKVLFKKRA